MKYDVLNSFDIEGCLAFGWTYFKEDSKSYVPMPGFWFGLNSYFDPIETCPLVLDPNSLKCLSCVPGPKFAYASILSFSLCSVNVKGILDL